MTTEYTHMLVSMFGVIALILTFFILVKKSN
jgi:flagellar biogenesis protein FliO